eukprot:6211424-Pleurochrysis_carterae.AAC.8
MHGEERSKELSGSRCRDGLRAWRAINLGNHNYNLTYVTVAVSVDRALAELDTLSYALAELNAAAVWRRRAGQCRTPRLSQLLTERHTQRGSELAREGDPSTDQCSGWRARSIYLGPYRHTEGPRSRDTGDRVTQILFVRVYTGSPAGVEVGNSSGKLRTNLQMGNVTRALILERAQCPIAPDLEHIVGEGAEVRRATKTNRRLHIVSPRGILRRSSTVRARPCLMA